MIHAVTSAKLLAQKIDEPKLSEHRLLAADQIMSALDFRATSDDDVAAEFAELYLGLYDRLGCRIFQSWPQMLEYERNRRGPDFSHEDLQALIGPDLYMLECGLWISFLKYGDKSPESPESPEIRTEIKFESVRSNGDATQDYDVTFPPGIRVGEFVKAITGDPNRADEYGAFKIGKPKDPLKISTETIAECCYGRKDGKPAVAESVAALEICKIRACGGWGLMNYHITVKGE